MSFSTPDKKRERDQERLDAIEEELLEIEAKMEQLEERRDELLRQREEELRESQSPKSIPHSMARNFDKRSQEFSPFYTKNSVF